jgi:hypothetical protein
LCRVEFQTVIAVASLPLALPEYGVRGLSRLARRNKPNRQFNALVKTAMENEAVQQSHSNRQRPSACQEDDSLHEPV